MPTFENIAPFLEDPFVLAGFAVFLFFSFSRLLIQKKIIPPLPASKGFKILQLILMYGFVLGLVIIVLAFWHKHGEMSEGEQRRVVSRMEGEVHANMKVATDLGLNLQTILNGTSTVSNLLRHEEIPLLRNLFPDQNRDPALADALPAPLDLARNALEEAVRVQEGLSEIERSRFSQAAMAIRGTIQRTRGTLESLADQDETRYVMQRAVWDGNQSILRKIEIYDFDDVQASYAQVQSIQRRYGVVVDHCLEFLDSVHAFFDTAPTVSDEQRLAAVLAHERLMISLLSRYGLDLADEIVRLQRLRSTLEEAAETG